jgi:hypothetical protein
MRIFLSTLSNRTNQRLSLLRDALFWLIVALVLDYNDASCETDSHYQYKHQRHDDDVNQAETAITVGILVRILWIQTGDD